MKDYESAAEEALARYRELRREAVDTKRRIEAISGTATAQRQTVKVTVNVQGELLAIEFPTGAYKRMTPNELAEAIKSTSADAKAKAMDQLEELMGPKLRTGLSARELVEGKVDRLAGLSDEPAMPDAVSDYLRRGRPGASRLGGAS